MTNRRGVLAALVAVSLAGAALRADEPSPSDAAADAWLRLVDGGEYARSWEQAAQHFKAAVRRDDWVEKVGSVRKPLGKLVSRSLRSREYKDRMLGAPDGKYVVIQYDTVFENKASAVETVVPMVDADGAWRVSGYFVR